MLMKNATPMTPQTHKQNSFFKQNDMISEIDSFFFWFQKETEQITRTKKSYLPTYRYLPILILAWVSERKHLIIYFWPNIKGARGECLQPTSLGYQQTLQHLLPFIKFHDTDVKNTNKFINKYK